MLGRTLRLPVIRRVEIHDYPMYPVTGGLIHEFVQGVNAIVGINGLGKTTLLNVLLRMILGPWDPRKADVQEPGAKLHELTELKRFNYFASRIGADARQASVLIELSFGKDTLRLIRDLGPKLQIKELWHNRLKVAADDEVNYEQRYNELVAEISGIHSRYDFDFVVRNLLFFLEDKVPLIWNPKGQFEILRILFLDENLSAEAANAHDALLQADSQYRNQLWQTNRLRDEHATALASMSAAPEQSITLEAARKALEGSDAKYQEIESAFSSLTEQAEHEKARIFEGEQKAAALSRHLEQIEVEYLRRAFPDLSERTELVLGSLLTSGQCPVCGNTNHQATSRLKKLLSAAQCPCCESVIGRHGDILSIPGEEIRQIRDLERRLRATESDIDKAKAAHDLLDRERTDTMETLYAVQRERAELTHRVRMLEADIPPGDDEFNRLKEGLRQQEFQVEVLKKKRADAQAKYDKLLNRARDGISAVANSIVRAFTNYARNFLLEDSQLTYELHKRSVGESGPMMSFPSFVLKMSSGAAPIGSVRNSADEVSESQKEFVDLAFRMAIIEVCNRRAGEGMLVIETPESSLDSVFIERAGELLRDFAGEGKKSNLVIATTNLNKENMLGHLLGIARQAPKTEKARAEVASRLINLLKVAAPTRAYRDNRRAYNEALRDALGFTP